MSSVSELNDAPLNHSTQNNDDEMKNNNTNRISDKKSNHTYVITDHDSGIDIDDINAVTRETIEQVEIPYIIFCLC